MPDVLRKPFKPVHKLLIAGAWFFVVASLLHLAWAVGMLLDGSPTTTVKLYHTIVGGVSHDAWGLTYTGGGGLAHALAQTLVVLAAATMSTFSAKGPRRLKLKRIGHGILTIWAAWWAFGLIRLAGIDGQIDSALQASFMTALFGCTAYRAARGSIRPSGTDGGSSKPIRRPDFVPVEHNDPAAPSDEPGQSSGDEGPSSPTGQFFAAIAPDRPKTEPAPRRSKFRRAARNRALRLAKVRDWTNEHINREQAARWRDKANDVAKRGHAFIVTNGRRVGRRAKPVAQTAWRESKNAWRKTIDALKDAEQMKSSDAT